MKIKIEFDLGQVPMIAAQGASRIATYIVVALSIFYWALHLNGVNQDAFDLAAPIAVVGLSMITHSIDERAKRIKKLRQELGEGGE
ncbi:MAG: hypothetical protein L0922_07090 [Candidatus Mariimomonas ferrooxydans]